MGEIKIGTASWTDKTLIGSKLFYPTGPKGATSAEARLRFYAKNFPIVEVDSTYYFPPTERNSILWVERTPEDFTFHIKAYSLLTQHPTRPKSLFANLVGEVPAEHRKKRFLYQSHLPREAMDEVWKRFVAALMPLHSSGKLGVVHLQFPQWFVPGRKSRAYLLEARDRLGDFRIAVEFRNSMWLTEENTAETLGFLRSENIPLTCVDMPQGFPSSLPPIAESTSNLAYVRFHGRNVENWEGAHDTATPRFEYLYSEQELREWVPRLRELSANVRETHVLMNNCYQDYAVRNARQLADML